MLSAAVGVDTDRPHRSLNLTNWFVLNRIAVTGNSRSCGRKCQQDRNGDGQHCRPIVKRPDARRLVFDG